MITLQMNVQTWVQMTPDGYGSDSAALQLMTIDIDTHDSYDIVRFTGELEHLNL